MTKIAMDGHRYETIGVDLKTWFMMSRPLANKTGLHTMQAYQV